MGGNDGPDIAARYSRAHDVVWRSGPDRVLLQHVDGPPETAALDLVGDVAYVWLAIDEPATRDELTERLAEADVAVVDVDADLAYLLDHGVIEVTPDDHDHG